MLARLAAVLFLSLGLGTARAEERREDLVVWYTHFDCPVLNPSEPGATAANPIEPDHFDQALRTSLSAYATDAQRARFHCRYVRLSGILLWLVYYHYRARLYDHILAGHFGNADSYLIENFADPNARRGDLVNRRVTLVGRFYDLCAAAEEAERASGQAWLMLFGPCHYGSDKGMMLENVVIENVVDAAPRYLLGEGNRPLFGELTVVQGTDRAALIARTRVWAQLVQRGPEAYLTDYYARHPEVELEDRRDLQEFAQDSYVSYVHSLSRFQALRVARAQVEVFRDARHEDRSSAYGCICLARSCGDEWPLVSDDARYFLGDAVCVSLNREGDEWTW